MERPSDRRNGGEDGDVEVTRSVRLLLRYCYAMQSAVLHGTRWNGGGGFPGARLTMRAMLRRVGPAPRALSPVGRFLPCGPRTSRAPHVSATPDQIDHLEEAQMDRSSWSWSLIKFIITSCMCCVHTYHLGCMVSMDHTVANTK